MFAILAGALFCAFGIINVVLPKFFAEFRIVYEARKKAVDFIQDSDKSILFIWDKTDAWIGAEKADMVSLLSCSG